MLHGLQESYIRIRIPVFLKMNHSIASSHAVTADKNLSSEKFTESWAIVVTSGILFTLTYRSEQFWKQYGGTFLS